MRLLKLLLCNLLWLGPGSLLFAQEATIRPNDALIFGKHSTCASQHRRTGRSLHAVSLGFDVELASTAA